MFQNKKEKNWMETLVYGLLSLVFGMAFFFGTLYPSYGFSPESYAVVQEDAATKQREQTQTGENRRLPDFDWTTQDMESIMKRYDRSEIQYRFYFYERVKNI